MASSCYCISLVDIEALGVMLLCYLVTPCMPTTSLERFTWSQSEETTKTSYANLGVF
jgi:hypothetical protein